MVVDKRQFVIMVATFPCNHGCNHYGGNYPSNRAGQLSQGIRTNFVLIPWSTHFYAVGKLATPLSLIVILFLSTELLIPPVLRSD